MWLSLSPGTPSEADRGGRAGRGRRSSWERATDEFRPPSWEERLSRESAGRYRHDNDSSAAVDQCASAARSRMGDHIWLQEGPADGDAVKFRGPAASRQPGLGGIPDVDEHGNWPGDGGARLVRTREPGEGENRRREDRSTRAQPVRQALKPHLRQAELGGALQALGLALRLQCPGGPGRGGRARPSRARKTAPEPSARPPQEARAAMDP